MPRSARWDLSDSTLSGNTAVLGGGIFNAAGTATITNSTLFNNTARDDGGGIYNYSGTVTVTGSTFSKNTPDNITGLYIDGGGNTFS
jgi:hypothetical protein